MSNDTQGQPLHPESLLHGLDHVQTARMCPEVLISLTHGIRSGIQDAGANLVEESEIARLWWGLTMVDAIRGAGDLGALQRAECLRVIDDLRAQIAAVAVPDPN